MGGTAWVFISGLPERKEANCPLSENVKTSPWCHKKPCVNPFLLKYPPDGELAEGREAPVAAQDLAVGLAPWAHPEGFVVLDSFICASLQLPRDPDWPWAEIELRGGTCLIRWASCVLCSPLPAPGPRAWEGETTGFVSRCGQFACLGHFCL